MNGGGETGGMDRRAVLRWVAAASAGMGLRGLPVAQDPVPERARPAASGYGTDPLLNATHERGAFWPLTLEPDQRRCLTALCDVILPADGETSPAASAVGVPDFIDEWISAPYEPFRAHRPVVVGGLSWLDREATQRFGSPFSELGERQQHALCDDVCSLARARPEHRDAATAFALLRDLTLGAYATTRVGMTDLGYRGNVPQPSYDGPPAEVRRRVGL